MTELATVNSTNIQPVIDLVCNAVTSHHTKRAYQRALTDFMVWYRLDTHRTGFSKATVQAHVTPVAITAHVEPLHSAELNTDDATPAPDIDTVRALALDAKRTAKANRQHELLQILLTEFNGQPADALNKTELGQRLGATRQTVGRDIDELIEAQRLSVNGHIQVM